MSSVSKPAVTPPDMLKDGAKKSVNCTLGCAEVTRVEQRNGRTVVVIAVTPVDEWDCYEKELKQILVCCSTNVTLKIMTDEGTIELISAPMKLVASNMMARATDGFLREVEKRFPITLSKGGKRKLGAFSQELLNPFSDASRRRQERIEATLARRKARLEAEPA